jgi:hypothetical protein
MATVYKSKIDWWLAAILVVAMVASLFAGLRTLSESPAWIAALVGGPGLLLPLVALLSTRYVIREDQLIVRSGPFKWRIPIAEISGITPTHDPIASPALSLDRLRIAYGHKKSLLISPHDRDGFLQQIAALRSAV